VGGGGVDYANAIAVDSAQEAFVAGYTGSPDFPTASPFQASQGPGQTAFVTKLSANATPTPALPLVGVLVIGASLVGAGISGLRRRKEAT
jgi:hypothetical protein